jgi:hypothetical protein
MTLRYRIKLYHQERMRFPVTWKSLVDPRTWKHVAANLLVSATYIQAR